MTDRLSDDEISARLEGGAWEREGHSIAREWKLADFGGAIEFVTRVADVAERANHHPDILLHGWNKVKLTISTHSAGGLTAADFDLAQQLDDLA